MITSPRYKVCRRLGAGVYDKCQTQSFVLSEAKHAKANKGRRVKALSDFGKQLLEKQKVRLSYGISERQLVRYVEESNRAVKTGTEPATKLVQLLESRLDNVVYRVGLAPSRRAARQMVAHGHLSVNGKRTTSPSFKLGVGDSFTLKERLKESPMVAQRKDDIERVTAPSWLSFDSSKLTGKVVGIPNREQIEVAGDVGVVIEFYSR